MPTKKQSEQEKIELLKQEELRNLLEDVGNIIEDEQFAKAKDKLQVIIRDAKRFHLNIILNIAQAYYNYCKDPTKRKFERKKIQSELELPKFSRRELILGKEFKVNKYITLKKGGTISITEIHVKGHTLVSWHSSISITERNEENTQEEFSKRCLSIKKWVESEYDKTILPHDISLPILKRLSDLGEPIAKKVFKREVLTGVLNGESDLVNLILNNNYLNLFNEEDLGKLFDERNIKSFAGGITFPYNLKKLIKFDEDFGKLVLKNDINYYLKSDNFEVFRKILREELLDTFSEEEFQNFDLKKLDNALFKLLKEELDYCLKWHFDLEEKFKSIQEVSRFLIYRDSESILNFFKELFTNLNKEQKTILISYLLFEQNNIQQSIFEKLKKNLKNLDWRQISFIIIDNIVRASETDKKNYKLNEITIDLIEKCNLSFLNLLLEEIKKNLKKAISTSKERQGWRRFYLFGTLLENNPRILREFLSNHYGDLNNEEKCWVMTTFIIYKESPEFLMESLKKKYEQLDLIEFSGIVSSGNYVLNKQNLEKLGELGLKILLNIIIYDKYEYNFEYRDEIGKLMTNIIKENENLKILIIECLLASFQANFYEAIVSIFNTEIVKLLNKNDVIQISQNSGGHFQRIIDKIFEEECPPTYLEYFLSKLGPEGGDLIFKFTQKHDYMDYMTEVMREMGEDFVEPFIKNLVINESDYQYGDWGYEFVEKFFEIFNKEQITQLFEDKELNLVNRLINSYFPARMNQEIIIFLIRAYEHLDKDYIIKIHKKLTKKMKEEIETYFYQVQDYGSSKIKEYNEILQLIGQQNEAFLNILHIYEEFSSIPLFGDLKERLKDKDFNLPKNMMSILSDIRILLEENKNLFSPESYGSEDKNYIKDLFYEFEKFLQYIIFEYFATSIDEMLEQLAHFFDFLLVLNEIIQEEVEINFTYYDLNKLKNENYEYYKGQGIFLKEPVWMEKHRNLYRKLFLKPHPYPTIRMRWWGEHWEKYISKRDNNLKNEFAYYFAEREYANTFYKKISLEIVDEKLFINLNWNLPNIKKTALRRLNDSSCRFNENRENVIFGLSLPRNYYRECALEFLRKMDGTSSNKSINDFVKELSDLKQQEVIKNLIVAISQKNLKERESAATNLDQIESKYKNMSLNRILHNLDEDS